MDPQREKTSAISSDRLGPETKERTRQSVGPLQPPVDFVIVTALEEERDAVLDKLPGHQRLMPAEDQIRVYFRSDLPTTFPDGSTGNYRVILMPLLGMGRVQAATATSDAITRWHPRYVILVGIAGGVVASKVKLGDILVSDQIVDYELQKLTPTGPEMRWEVHRADPRLVGATRNFSSESWQGLMKTSRPIAGKPERHIGPIASGDKVIAFSEVLTKYLDTWPRLIGVEMEAAGVTAAAFQAASLPGFFMVRGVSDMADEAKGSDPVESWRPYACDVAASYAVGLLKSGPVPISNADVTEEPPKSTSLDTRILQALYAYYLRHKGEPRMNLNELVAACMAKRDDVLQCLLGLQEKKWLDYDLTVAAETGQVWLTAHGIRVSEDVYGNKSGKQNS